MCAAASVVATLFIIIFFFSFDKRNAHKTAAPPPCGRTREETLSPTPTPPQPPPSPPTGSTRAVVVIVIGITLYAYHYAHTHIRLPYCKADIYIYMRVKIINDGKNSIELALRFVVRTRSNLLHPLAGPPVRSLRLRWVDDPRGMSRSTPSMTARLFFLPFSSHYYYCTEIRSLPVLADRPPRVRPAARRVSPRAA